MDTPALPSSLRWAIWLILAEGATLAGLAALLGYREITAEVVDAGRGLAVIVYVLIVAAVLVLIGVQLGRRRAWPRGLAIALQLMLVAVAYYLIRGGLFWIGVPAGVAAIAVIWLLVQPATRDALGVR